MKPQQLADLLNITSATLRRWAGKEYIEFLSPNAQGANGVRRSFSDEDARIIAWIAMLKAQNTAAADITLTLRSAQLNGWRTLPPLPGGLAGDEPIAVVPREAVEERLRSIEDRYDAQVNAIREKYESQLQAVTKERDDLITRLDSTQGESRKLQERLTELADRESKLRDVLNQRIIELTSKEAELRGIASQYTVAGRRWNVGTLISVALFAGVILTVFIAILLTILHR